MAARGSANWEAGWVGGAERRGKLGKDLPSRFCRRVPPLPAGRISLLKGEGERSAEQRSQRNGAGLQAAHSEVIITPPPSIPALLCAQG